MTVYTVKKIYCVANKGFQIHFETLELAQEFMRENATGSSGLDIYTIDVFCN